MKFLDTDSWDLYPLKDGQVPPSSPKMRPIPEVGKGSRDNFFLFDDYYSEYIAQKNEGRAERVGKYYQVSEEPKNMPAVIDKLVDLLVSSDPINFTASKHLDTIVFRNKRKNEELLITNGQLNGSWVDIDGQSFMTDYEDAFDALAMQAQSDLVMVTARDDGSNYTSRISLFYPNGWDAETFIDKSFEEIHEEVTKADGSLVIPNGRKMVQGLVKMTRMVERVGAISWRNDTRLNRHPDTFTDPPAPWDFENKDLFLRFERQAVIGIPEANSFLFSIHTVFNQLSRKDRIDSAILALKNPHPDNYANHIFPSPADKFLEYLESKKTTF